LDLNLIDIGLAGWSPGTSLVTKRDYWLHKATLFLQRHNKKNNDKRLKKKQFKTTSEPQTP
jgi:hypothetical protein